ncbi:MAG TPA: AI-2E family transporter [Chthoniobacterales bacterium]|jgi:predicted PurR-regulated permease PerM
MNAGRHSVYPNEWQRRAIWSAVSALAICFLIFVFVAVIWIMANVVSFLQPILIPVAIAGILAYLLDPVVTRMSRHGLGRTKSVLLLFAIAAVALAALATWLLPVIWYQSTSVAKDLPQYTVKARDQVVDLLYRYNRTFGGGKTKNGTTSGVIDWLLGSPTPATSARPTAPARAPEQDALITPTPPVEEIAPAPAKVTSAERQRIQEYFEKQIPNVEKQLPNLMDKFWGILKKSIGGFLGFTGFLLSLILVPIYLFFLLKERPAIQRHWKEYLPLRDSPLKDEVATVIMQINSYIIAYFRGQLLVCLVDGILIGTTLSFLPRPGLNFAPLIGALVVVLTMIPYIGIILCWIPAVLIAAAQWGDWTHPLLVTLIFIVVQNLEGLFYAPRIVGNSVGLHPMTVIVSIFVWGLLIGGLLGPILAVPLTATIKVLLARYVWDRRLREEIAEEIDQVPVVQQAEIETAGA